MTRRLPRLPPVELNVVGVATGGALVSGALSLVGPYLVALPGSLAALAVAGWIAQLRRSAGSEVVRLPSGAPLALVVLSAGATGYVFATEALGPFRGLLLALALLPLWNVARHTPGVPP
jgi:hypothetical protein